MRPKLFPALDVGADELIQLYGAPGPRVRPSPWVRANFVVTLDGAVDVAGSSSSLTTPLDQHVLKILRDLSDVLLVGANTIRAEDYIGIRPTELGQRWRREHGLPAVPPIAVVSGNADIDPESRLLTNTLVPPIILTTTTAPAAAKEALAAGGAEVLELGSSQLSPTVILQTLSDLGLNQVVCEGGPTLTGQLAVDGLLDELCVTTVPRMVAGDSPRITQSDRRAAVEMECRHIIVDDDGTQLARWIR